MTQAEPNLTVRRKRWILAGSLPLLVVLAASIYWFSRETTEERADRLLAQARASYLAGRTQEAEDLARAALAGDSRPGEAALIAARCAAARRAYSEAVDYLGRIDANDRQLRVSADLFAAQLYHHHLHRLSDAEDRYRSALAVDADNPDANTGLAGLLGLCGRSREAAPYVLRMVRLGRPTDQLFLIARASGAVNDLQALEQARLAAPNDVNTLLGLAWQAAADERHDEALDLLRKSVRLHPEHRAARLALGRQLLAMRRFDALTQWMNATPPDLKQFGDYWLIQGQLAEQRDDAGPAIRCYWEAIQRNPESATAHSRLAKLLAAADRRRESEPFVRYFEQLLQLRTMQDRAWSHSDSNPGRILAMCRAYESLGRYWEAYGWSLLGAGRYPDDRILENYVARIRSMAHGVPLKLTADAANPASNVDLSSYPLPDFDRESPAAESVRAARNGPLRFAEEASTAGLDFRYFNGTADRPSRRMFEFTGGGIGVLDFDLDGFPDVFCSQGISWPPASNSANYQDQLFQNQNGESFHNVSGWAGIGESGFGQGITVGDFNSDGFPDLYVANIGPNQLWVNNGDGTFTDGTGSAGLIGKEWTTSCLMADLSGDGLPDIYDVNYLTGEGIYERVCLQLDGTPAMCLPFEFDGTMDRFWLNAGDGSFVDVTASRLSALPHGKGLGVAAWASNGGRRLNLFVANDTTPNFLFVPDAGAGGFDFEERGLVSGLACNGEGKAEGCMGIALADVDGDGRLDVHVTNFLAESNTLWLQKSDDLFDDATRAAGLDAATINMLGFGTQFLDADLDGELELFVANGHVDDLQASGRPYEMHPQMFRWNGNRFVESDSAGIGRYFQERWLGRAVARLDWNRDGRDDLIVGHLQKPTALLTNRTKAGGRFLSFRLVGIDSGRDAVGTTVKVRIGKRVHVKQLTAGDGYLASNERRLIFGVGDTATVDEVTVCWLSGHVQTFHRVSAAHRFLLVEGGNLLSLGAPPTRTQTLNLPVDSRSAPCATPHATASISSGITMRFQRVIGVASCGQRGGGIPETPSYRETRPQ